MSKKLNKVKVMYKSYIDGQDVAFHLEPVFAAESYDPSVVRVLEWMSMSDDKDDHCWQFGEENCVDGSNYAIRDTIDEAVDWFCEKEGINKHVNNLIFKFRSSPSDADKYAQLPEGLTVDVEDLAHLTCMKDIVNEVGEVTVIVDGETMSENNIVRFDHENCLVDYGQGFRHAVSLDIKPKNGIGDIAGF